VFRYAVVGPLLGRGVLPLVISTLALSVLLKEAAKDFYSAEAQTDRKSTRLSSDLCSVTPWSARCSAAECCRW